MPIERKNRSERKIKSKYTRNEMMYLSYPTVYKKPKSLVKKEKLKNFGSLRPIKNKRKVQYSGKQIKSLNKRQTDLFNKEKDLNKKLDKNIDRQKVLRQRITKMGAKTPFKETKAWKTTNRQYDTLVKREAVIMKQKADTEAKYISVRRNYFTALQINYDRKAKLLRDKRSSVHDDYIRVGKSTKKGDLQRAKKLDYKIKRMNKNIRTLEHESRLNKQLAEIFDDF